MSNNTGKVVKAGIGYTIGNILVKGINLLTLPIFSRLLTTEEFGVFSLFVSYETILTILLSVALNTSTKSANLEFRGKIDQYTSSISLIFVVNALLYISIIIGFGGLISELIGLDRSVLVLMVVYCFGGSIFSLYVSRISLDYSYKKYLFISFLNSVGNICISLLLILTVFSSDRAFGRILGATIAIGFVAVVIMVDLYKAARPRYNKDYWKFGLKYSMPLVPHGLSQVLLGQVDKIMIDAMVSKAALGIYSLAGNIKLIMIIISDSISNAWGAWFFEMIDSGQTDKICNRASQLVMLFL